MRQAIVMELFICDTCKKGEVRPKVIERDWVAVPDGEYITNDYCGEECAFTAEEQDKARSKSKTIEEEANAPHGL